MKGTRRFSLTLALLILVSLLLAPGASAVRSTDFFQDQPHTQLMFSQIEYVLPDTTQFYTLLTQIQDLCGSSRNAARVEELFGRLAGQYTHMITMYCLASIHTSQDATDQAAAAELSACNTICLVAGDELYGLAQVLLDSPCGGFLRDTVPSKFLTEIGEYEAMTPEQLSLLEQEQDLVNEYSTASLTPFSVEYQGRSWTEAELDRAYGDGAIEEDAYLSLLRDTARQRAALLGEIYLRMVAVRREIAAADGFDNYADYCYETIYTRDYTPQEIRAFQAAVKQYIVPVYQRLSTLTNSSDDPIFYADYSGQELLDMVGPLLPEMSDELVEAWQYMLDHQTYDLEERDTKLSGGFTTNLYEYGAPFLYNAPNHSLYDFNTVVHEFGHYNSAYWEQAHWYQFNTNIDLAEVHSQGFELLFSHYYPQLFGESAQAAETYLMCNLVGAMVEGCLHDELQQYVFSTENLTVEQINQEYMRLLREYGLAEEDDPRTEAYSWADVPHTFQTPFYYVSYAVSAAGALELWSRSSNDYTGALDQYLEFVSLQYDRGFQDTFAAVGLANPLSQEYLGQLAEGLDRELDISRRYQALMAEDETKLQPPQPEPEEQETPLSPTYTVQRGDCLIKIGAALGVDWRTLAELNGLRSPYTIYVGQQLKLT